MSVCRESTCDVGVRDGGREHLKLPAKVATKFGRRFAIWCADRTVRAKPCLAPPQLRPWRPTPSGREVGHALECMAKVGVAHIIPSAAMPPRIPIFTCLKAPAGNAADSIHQHLALTLNSPAAVLSPPRILYHSFSLCLDCDPAQETPRPICDCSGKGAQRCQLEQA